MDCPHGCRSRAWRGPLYSIEEEKMGTSEAKTCGNVEVDYDQAGKKEARQSDASMVIAHPRL
jgi:hypothetical protein